MEEEKVTLQENLKNRIRGWFPQEPQFTKAIPAGKMPQVPQAYPSIDQYLRTSHSVTKSVLIMANCFGVPGCLGLAVTTIFATYSLGIGDIFWVLACITVGLLTGLLSTQGQLKQLAQTNQVPIHGKYFKFEMVVMLLFAVATLLIGIQIHAMRTVFSPIGASTSYSRDMKKSEKST
jgi:hypothetical protein